MMATVLIIYQVTYRLVIVLTIYQVTFMLATIPVIYQITFRLKVPITYQVILRW